jgi:hypothetical protein
MIHADLLGQLYDLGQRDMKIGVVMMPLMAHLRKAVKRGADNKPE